MNRTSPLENSPLTEVFILDSDDLGRDLFSRIVYGARISMIWRGCRRNNIIFVSILGPSLFNTMIAIGISQVPRYARVIRASVLAESNIHPWKRLVRGT